MIPAIENLKRSLLLLILVRNGVVHAGHMERDKEASVLVPFLRACDHLLADSRMGDRASFWGDALDVVDARLARSAGDAARIRCADAITVARALFEDRYASMDPAVRKAVIASIEASYLPEKYEQTLIACPACGSVALVYGSYEVDWEADWDYADGKPLLVGAYPVVRFSPGDTLECRACDLVLDGEDELQAADIPFTWQLDDSEVEPPTSTSPTTSISRSAPIASCVARSTSVDEIVIAEQIVEGHAQLMAGIAGLDHDGST